ncbi:MAG: hypothetical protein NZ108_02950 [Bacteroidia bacterium]|nr:hypothetical protein [Bacteroidia bacterium]
MTQCSSWVKEVMQRSEIKGYIPIQTFFGNLAAQEAEWIKIDLQAGVTYRILSHAEEGNGPVLFAIYNKQNKQLITNVDGENHSVNRWIDFECTATDSYQIGYYLVQGAGCAGLVLCYRLR